MGLIAKKIDLAITVHLQNDWLDCIRLEQLSNIWSD